MSDSPDLTMDDLQSLKSIKLTKRVLLGFTNGIYDIAGLISPVTNHQDQDRAQETIQQREQGPGVG